MLDGIEDSVDELVMRDNSEESMILEKVVRKTDPLKDELNKLIKKLEEGGTTVDMIYTDLDTEPYFDKDAIGFENVLNYEGTDHFRKIKGRKADDRKDFRRLLYLEVFQAIKDRASDIYFEKFEDRMKVKYVIDGLSNEMHTSTGCLYTNIMQELEAEFGILKFEEIEHRKLGLFGKITKVETKIKRLREFNDGEVASLTSNGINFNLMKAASKYGPQYRLKIFHENEFRDLEDLFDEENVFKIRKDMLGKEKGLVLVAGAPNNGRTTTLNYLLHHADRPYTLTISIGRGYAPNNIHRFQVSPNNPNYTNTLKAIRTLNPNVVLLDDIEDAETAKEAVRYASSGALVLASVPSDDAITGIEYLLSLGVNPSLLADSLQGIIGQTLVRKICDDCKKEYRPDEDLLKELKLAENFTAHYGSGNNEDGVSCDKCDTVGYLGRIPIFQLIGSEDKAMGEIKCKLKAGEHLDQLVPSLKESGKAKIMEGLTTIEEVLKI